jgi:hypothetical protein
MLPAVPHVSFGIFNLAIPDIVAWILVFAIVLIAAGVRLPKLFEPDARA